VEVNYDLIVVGGGPAGCAAAITAARNRASVLLLERGRYPRHKVCGEFISPESVAVLSSLLMPEDRNRLIDAALKIGAMRIFVDGRTIRAPIAPPAISVTRYELDLALWRACEAAGVDARQNIAADRIEGHNTVFGSGHRFTARAVVDATGRWSNLRLDRVVKGTAQFIGLKGHFAETNAPCSADLYFFPGGYCGVQPVADGVVNVCAMVRADVAARLEDVFGLEPRLALRAESWTALMAPVSTFPLIFRKPVPVENGIFHAGDAAGFVDPFVGDGISLALQTGVAAAEALCPMWRQRESLNGAVKAYESEYDRRFRPVFRRAANVRRLFGLPLPLRAVAARIAQIPGVSSGLVKLTRAG
jgi:flavin-dependent dehydrogenase